jgi:haloalkane dehalogenase
MSGLAYREEGEGDRVALLVHGYPESSYMWRHLMHRLAAERWRTVAPDLAGFGDSPPDGPGTWEAHVDRLARFHEEHDLGRVVLVTHDWGVLIGLRWACDNPDAVRGLVISDGGFFADRRWHDVANVMRTPGEGEKLMDAITREALAAALPAVSEDALDEYWKGFATEDRRRAHLELYRSGDFEKLEPYEGKLAALSVPSLIVWGTDDRFASVKMAHRFHEELPGSDLALAAAGHFVWEEAPETANGAVVRFLSRVP